MSLSLSLSLLRLITHASSSAQESVKAAHATAFVPHGQIFLQPASDAVNEQSTNCQPKTLVARLKKHVMPR